MSLMTERRFRRDFVGRRVVDTHGEELGQVADTWPQDGGGEVEMLLVKMGRFNRRRWIPADGARRLNDHLFVPMTRFEIDDAPDAEDHRWGRPADVARAHWALMLDD